MFLGRKRGLTSAIVEGGVVSKDVELHLLRVAAGLPAPITELIGYGTYARPFESWYAYVSRLIRTNSMNSLEIRARLPRQWLDLACDPFQESGAEMPVDLPVSADGRIQAMKVHARAWIPYPGLCSVQTECLRGCPTCLGNGYHCYATQSDLFTVCPVHGKGLIQHCPHCNRPLYWHGLGRTLHAFHCPSGCSLTRSHASGLIIHEEATLEAAWTRYLREIATLKQTITFHCGPIHVVYPPSTADLSRRAPTVPAPGLLAALWSALEGQGVKIPRLHLFDVPPPTRWHIVLSPWTMVESGLDAPRRDRMLRGFRRSAYWTSVPLTQPAETIGWISASVHAHGPWLAQYAIREDDGVVWLDFPSYLLTNGEVTALRRALRCDQPVGYPASTAAYYESLLLDLLAGARARREALDAMRDGGEVISESSGLHRDALNVSERVDAIVSTPLGQWQLRAFIVADAAVSWRTWVDYRDPAELADDAWIHIERREDAF